MPRARAARPKDDAIEMLLALSQSELLLEQIYVALEQTIRASVKQMLREQALSPAQHRAMRRVPAKVLAELRAECSWSLLRPQILSTYRRIFDREKIDGLIRFYRSRVGGAYQQAMIATLHGSMALAQAQASLLPKMKQAMDKAVREATRVRTRAVVSPRKSSSNQSKDPRNIGRHVRVRALAPSSLIHQRRQS